MWLAYSYKYKLTCFIYLRDCHRVFSVPKNSLCLLSCNVDKYNVSLHSMKHKYICICTVRINVYTRYIRYKNSYIFVLTSTYVHIRIQIQTSTFVHMGGATLSSLRPGPQQILNIWFQMTSVTSLIPRLVINKLLCNGNYTTHYCLPLIGIRDGKARPGQLAETGRAWPENPGPRALRAETGLMIFYLRFLCDVCALCAGRWVITSELCIVVTCKCVVYWANVHGNETVVCACNLWTRYD